MEFGLLKDMILPCKMVTALLVLHLRRQLPARSIKTTPVSHLLAVNCISLLFLILPWLKRHSPCAVILKGILEHPLFYKRSLIL